jgi:hypothetical protein
MPKKVHFIWATPDSRWTWTATRYEGNGIFYGRVNSPYVPDGEYGTWYLWEVEKHANLVEGDRKLLDEIREKAKNVMKMQRSVIGALW